MHTVHFPVEKDSKTIAAAMGLMFSDKEEDLTRKFSDEEVAVIDKFFDDLSWE